MTATEQRKAAHRERMAGYAQQIETLKRQNAAMKRALWARQWQHYLSRLPATVPGMTLDEFIRKYDTEAA